MGSALDEKAGGAYYSEIQYCEALPMTHSKSSTESKIDELLMRVRRIDKTLNVEGLNRPAVPPKPPKPQSNAGRATMANMGRMWQGPTSPEVPPPRPEKNRRDARSPTIGSAKTLPKPECDFLVAQLRNVRSYLDEMVDDDFDGKLENISTIDSVIGALLCQ